MRPERRFAFRLALALGMTVQRLLNSMSSREFSEWIALSRIEPIGDVRGDLRAGIVASAVWRAAGGKAKVDDFIPDWDKPDDDVADQVNAVMQMERKRFKRKKK